MYQIDSSTNGLAAFAKPFIAPFIKPFIAGSSGLLVLAFSIPAITPCIGSEITP